MPVTNALAFEAETPPVLPDPRARPGGSTESPQDRFHQRLGICSAGKSFDPGRAHLHREDGIDPNVVVSPLNCEFARELIDRAFGCAVHQITAPES